MPNFMYCIYLGENMGDIGPCLIEDILLLVFGKYNLVSKFKGGDYFYNIVNNYEYDSINGVRLMTLGGKLFINNHVKYLDEYYAMSQFLYIDIESLHEFLPDLVHEVVEICNKYCDSDTGNNWVVIPEDNPYTLFNVRDLRRLLRNHLPDLDNPCIEYLKES